MLGTGTLRRFPFAVVALAAIPGTCLRGADPAPEQVEFFEKRVRPALVRSCYPCHSGAIASPMGGLRVDSREALAAGGQRGPAVVAGEPEASPLYRALTYAGELKMPPSGKLPDVEIADIGEWIRMGAPYPGAEGGAKAPAAPLEKARRSWPFRPVQDPPVPAVKNTGWVRTPVDAFVLAKLEAARLEPAPPADKRSLIRRATFDLTGLPPTPDEVDAFLRDSSPDAFGRVVDRLLASPQYGERWARHWLDLVRYAETNGHEFDNDKPAPWRYRDYVIRAFNADAPYDQFVREHIAGDLLPRKRLSEDGALEESPLGTVFFWFGEVLNSATDSVKSRADEVDNQIDVVGKAFQGLTIACARCHDHKFDPIPTADYYSLAGIFHSTALREDALDSPERAAATRELSRRIREVNARIEALEGAVPASRPAIRYRPEDAPFETFEGGFGAWRTAGAAFGEGPVNGEASSLGAGAEAFTGTLTSPKFRTTDKLFLHVRVSGTKADEKLKERGPLRFTIVADGYKGQHIVPDGTPGAYWKTLRLVLERNRDCYFEIVDHSREGYIAVDEIVFSDSAEPPENPAAPERGGAGAVSADSGELERLRLLRRQLEAQAPEPAYAMLASDDWPRNARIHVRGNHQQLGEEAPRGYLRVLNGGAAAVREGSGRLQLAERLASPDNPLTSRVMVNRIWKHHFARGIVRTPDNFGATGDAPTHPELLDYLASRFVESGWSVKAIHRLTMLSSAYRMSSESAAEALRADPENKLLHHMPVRRLEAEAIRDSLLSVAGALDAKMFGPSVPPHISKYQDGRGKPESGPLDGEGRRSIYIQARRNFLTPMFLAFDYPLPVSSIGSRGSSTVPSQALLMMNNEFVAEQAGRWGRRAISQAADPRERVRWMYETAFARPPEPTEIDEILGFAEARRSRPEEEIWADIAHALVNSVEFIYLR
ncbi:MAG: PSD1 domain-containing protein [Bryobacteraceae bacterium]|nr:PSD1 domain-containing protein [Bryobacteraceae bacterium]